MTGHPPRDGAVVKGRNRDRLWLVRRALPEVRGDLEREWWHRYLLPERDALRSAKPGGVDGGAGCRRLGRVQGCQRRDSFHRVRDGEVQVLLSRRKHLGGP